MKPQHQNEKKKKQDETAKRNVKMKQQHQTKKKKKCEDETEKTNGNMKQQNQQKTCQDKTAKTNQDETTTPKKIKPSR